MSVRNTLTSKNESEHSGFVAYLSRDNVNKQIADAVGGKNSRRFITSIIAAVQATPTLQECTNTSIVSAALQGEALNLPPSPQLGYYFLVPFNNRKKGVKEAQFQLSAKGYKQLAMRSGQYKDIDVITIHDGEYLGRDKYTGKQKFEFIEDDDEREAAPIIGYLAYFEMLNGFRKQIYWSKAKMEKHADKYSQAFSLAAKKKIDAGEVPQNEMWKFSSYWYTSFDEMAEKTMIRQLLSKWGMLSLDMVTAFTADMAVINADGSAEYVEVERDAQEELEEKAPQIEADREDNAAETTADEKPAGQPEQVTFFG